MLYLQACKAAEAVEAMGWVPLAYVCDVQFGELCEELQVFKCILVEYVVAVHNLQASETSAY